MIIVLEASWKSENYTDNFSSVTQSCLTLCDPMNRSMSAGTVKVAQIISVSKNSSDFFHCFSYQILQKEEGRRKRKKDGRKERRKDRQGKNSLDSVAKIHIQFFCCLGFIAIYMKSLELRNRFEIKRGVCEKYFLPTLRKRVVFAL